MLKASQLIRDDSGSSFRIGSQPHRSLPLTPVSLIVFGTLSLMILLAFILIGRRWFSGWQYVHYPFHAAVEVSGGLIALWVSRLLLLLEKRRIGTSFNVWIAGGLIGMGVLDILHSLTHAGQVFVWLHSAATLLGGVLLMTVCLPSGWQHRVQQWWPSSILLLSLTMGVLAILFPGAIPVMVVDGQFTVWARMMNLIGGLLLFVSSAKIGFRFAANRNVDDLLFCILCILFGAAAILFEQSKLWDLSWWGWHMLRLIAFGVALYFVIESETRDQQALRLRARELAKLSMELESKVTDMTHEMQLKNENLVRSNRELEQFAYIASHDLQEPLRKIQSFGDILVDEFSGPLGNDGCDYLRRMQNASKRMQTLIDDLLTYARLTSQARTFVSTDLNAIAAEVVSDLESRIKQSEAQIQIGKLPVVSCDPIQIHQLLQNILGNAIKFHRPGVPPLITVQSQTRPCEAKTTQAVNVGSVCEITISDNGIGFDEKYQDKIFAPFQRLHGRSEYEGTGMGLAICRKILDRHGGSIAVHSQPGIGSTFVVILPL